METPISHSAIVIESRLCTLFLVVFICSLKNSFLSRTSLPTLLLLHGLVRLVLQCVWQICRLQTNRLPFYCPFFSMALVLRVWCGSWSQLDKMNPNVGVKRMGREGAIRCDVSREATPASQLYGGALFLKWGNVCECFFLLCIVSKPEHKTRTRLGLQQKGICWRQIQEARRKMAPDRHTRNGICLFYIPFVGKFYITL